MKNPNDSIGNRTSDLVAHRPNPVIRMLQSGISFTLINFKNRFFLPVDVSFYVQLAPSQVLVLKTMRQHYNILATAQIKPLLIQ
jgi:hypothetical protein